MRVVYRLGSKLWRRVGRWEEEVDRKPKGLLWLKPAIPEAGLGGRWTGGSLSLILRRDSAGATVGVLNGSSDAAWAVDDVLLSSSTSTGGI